MREISVTELQSAFGLGVAGNFAGHLEQAGEAADFTHVTPTAVGAPKGIFPWYVPGSETFLGQFPLSHDRLVLPASATPLNLQIEPEVGVVFAVAYNGAGRVQSLVPQAAGAFNDCSIRRPNAVKISEKKNWGPASKGLAASVFVLDDVEPDGGLRSLRIASFLRRADDVHEYGIDSAAAEYSYAGQRLIGWIGDRLANQAGSPDTPLEPVGEYLVAAGCPSTLVVGIGATRYTSYGESNFLEAGDESIVIVYDGAVTSPDQVQQAVREREEASLDRASVLTQVVSAAPSQ